MGALLDIDQRGEGGRKCFEIYELISCFTNAFTNSVCCYASWMQLSFCDRKLFRNKMCLYLQHVITVSISADKAACIKPNTRCCGICAVSVKVLGALDSRLVHIMSCGGFGDVFRVVCLPACYASDI